MDALFPCDQLMVFSESKACFDELDEGNDGLTTLMENLKEELDEELYVGEAFREVKHLEVVVPVLPPQLVQFAHQR